MNKRVFISMLVLTITFLVGLYILKIFFPNEFIMVIENEKLIAIGEFIDSHMVLYYICCAITAFITYYLYCCACCGRIKLKWYEILEIIAVIVVVRLISLFDASLSNAIQLSSFLFLPYLMKGKLKNSAITYTIHCVAQALSLSIRNLPLYLTNVNFITGLLMTLECYFWLVLLYIIFNYKQKGIENV